MKIKLTRKTILISLYLTLMLAVAFYDNSTDSQKIEYYIQKATESADNGDVAQAIIQVNKAIKVDPTYAGAYDFRSSIYFANEQFELALDDMTKVIELLPNNSEGYSLRGFTYELMGEYDKAIDDFSKTIALDPEYLYIYYCRAKAYEAIGKGDLAKYDREKAKELEQMEE